ncbi:hypothetical protein BH11PLA1_BH11PLA1_18680 [soil metagenome]
MPTHARQPELDLLVEVASIPTAAGKEQRVEKYIRAWAQRNAFGISADKAGNLVIASRHSAEASRAGAAAPAPLYITAHMDHPAFVVERIIGPGTVELSFRGGVNETFFHNAPIHLHLRDDSVLRGVLVGDAGQSSALGKHYLAEVGGEDGGDARRIEVGDIATWALAPAEIRESVLHAPACDDLAALAAALAAFAALYAQPDFHGDVRLLFTRAEEIGFIGAIAACKVKTMPSGSRIIALENSRAFADSPLGAGPIVRVGDRLSIFTPWLTAACAQRAEEIFGGAASPRASESASSASKRPWQRKLMSGGACEASVFCAAGYDATCICLPLGNYHNMPHLDLHQAGTYDSAALGPARCAREFIHIDDYLGMIDLLVALGRDIPGGAGIWGRMEKLYAEKQSVLELPATAK